MRIILILFCVLNLGMSAHLPLGVHSTCTKHGLLALTFDDGVSKYYPELLTILDRKKVKATFFVVGETLLSPTKFGYLQTAREKGHQIANHTFSHPDLLRLTDNKIESDVKETQNALLSEKIIRPPFGNVDQRVYDKLMGMGYSVVIWNLDAKDWNFRVPKERMWNIYERALNTANPAKESFIVLMHDKRHATLELLPAVIDLARERGFKLVTLKECLND